VNATYSAPDDALYVTLAKARGRIMTREASPGIFLDFDQRKALVGIEVLDASLHYSKATLARILSPQPPTRPPTRRTPTRRVARSVR